MYTNYVYKSLDHKIQSEFHELLMPGNEWKYINYETDTPYKVYSKVKPFLISLCLFVGFKSQTCIYLNVNENILETLLNWA